MTPFLDRDGVVLYEGDCVEALRELADASVDAIVTDPPYGINFMGKAWDGKAIEEAAQRESGRVMPPRLTGDLDHPDRRKLTERTGSAFANRAGEAGSYDFSLRGTRAFQAWVEQWAAECFRVLKPGGYLLSFGGTRTYHRLGAGIEDAGFEIRDCLAWMFGSGFPKSLDVSKAIDKAASVERTEPVGVKPGHEDFVDRTDAHAAGGRSDGWERPWRDDPEAVAASHLRFAPATAEAARWDGWGTALKPAFEPIVMARKPFRGTVAANVLAHGVGAINVDACRIGFASASDEAEAKGKNRHGDFESGEVVGYHGWDSRAGGGNYDPPGRWPANVILGHSPDCVPVGVREVASDGHYPAARPSGVEIGTVGHAGQDDLDERHTRGETVEVWECVPDCPVWLLDEQTGDLHSQDPATRLGSVGDGIFGRRTPSSNYGDAGASRFFYCAKTSRAERNAGLDGFEAEATVARNNHPTVKPIDVMRWLLRLVVPPGGTILDPFLGSGSTGCAAALEGFDFVGIELDPDYLAIADARIRFWQEHGDDGLRIVAERAAGERVRAEHAEIGQLDLLG